MGEKHTGWSRTHRGERASSGGKPRGSRVEDSALVDADGVPQRHTRHEKVDLPFGLVEAIRAGKPLDEWLGDD